MTGEPELLPIAHKADLPDRGEDAQRAFYDSVLERALRAEDAAGRVRHRIDLAGTSIELCFAGTALAQILMPALRHLEVKAAGPPQALFHIWDSASTGIAMVAPPVTHDCFTDRGDIWSFGSPVIRSAYHWVENALNLMDVPRGEAVCWFKDSGKLPYWTPASPLRTLFHWLMAARGGHLLHAACVGTEAGGVLVTGRGGVGKSTTALACLEAGMSYVADDYLVLRLDPTPRAYSLYCTAKLNADQMQRFPGLRSLLASSAIPTGEKAVLYLHPHHGGRLARSLPVVLHATPRFADGPETAYAPVSPLALRRAAAFTTMAQLPHAGRETNAFVERLVDAVPGATLALGHDIARIAEGLGRMPGRSLTEADTGTTTGLPLVTVVIPVHNGAHFLEDAIGSILRQNYPPIEIIVVDDGSTDDIDAAVRRLPVDVRFFRQHNAGPAAARNRGIRDASGELVAFLDVDDLWVPDMLASLVGLMRASPDLEVAQGSAQLVRIEACGEMHYLGNAAETFPFHIGSAVYRRSVFATVGLFDATLRFGEDTDWFNRLRESGARHERVPQVTLLVRRHEANMTRGRTVTEVNALRVFKKMLDRRRAALPD